jgi:hypothetical protein
MCNNSAKDNLGQVLISFGRPLGQPLADARIRALRQCMTGRHQAAIFNIGEVGMRPVLGIASGSNVMSVSSK